MGADYDAPRGGVDLAVESLEDFKTRREDGRSAVADVDVDDAGDVHGPPDAELLDDEDFSVAVVAMRGNEFRCARCFLVYHRTQLAARRGADLVCRECA